MAPIVPPTITAVLFPVVPEDRSEPKLAVTNKVKLDSVRVEVSVGVVWKVLVDICSFCAAVALVMVMVDVGIACNSTALELAAERE